MLSLTPFNRRNIDVQRRARDFFDADTWLDNFFQDAFTPTIFGFGNTMKVDIKEREKDYLIEVDLPGVNKDEINIELRDDVLTIAVQRNEVTEEERHNYIRKERRTSSMCRSFRVDNVRPEDVNAKFENGVLSISLPKSEDSHKPHYKININ